MSKLSRNYSNLKYLIKETDWILFLTCILTSVFGSLMVYSASHREIAEGSFIARECLTTVIGSILGIALCVIISMIDYEVFLRLTPYIAVVSVIMLCLLFKFGWAPPDRPDSRCWFDLKIIYFQPSELVKIGFIISFSTHLEAVKEDINSIKNFALLCLHGIIPIGLVIATGDVGSALVFIFIFGGLLFFAGLELRYFAVAAVAAVIAAPILWIKYFSTFQKNRVLAIYYPSSMDEKTYSDVIYQQDRGIRTIGSGSLFGDGFLKGKLTQSGYVPVNKSDMIFSVIGEELGFIGCILLLVLIAFIVIRIVIDGKGSKNFSGYLLCCGTGIMIAAQAIINIGMCMGLLPCIGITLPFISSGGSSNLCIYIGIGVVLSVYRHNCERNPVNFRVGHLSTPFKEL